MHLVQIVIVYQVDEELASPSVRSGVCHADGSPIILVMLCKLIFNGIAGPAAPSAGRISSLDHESINDPMKDGSVVKAILDELFEVASSNWHIIIKLKGDISHICIQQYLYRSALRRTFCHERCIEESFDIKILGRQDIGPLFMTSVLSHYLSNLRAKNQMQSYIFLAAVSRLMARNQKDHYYRRAKAEGYRARSSYKLLQINEKFHIIKKGDSVVDLGAAPGGWLQVARELSGGLVIGVDLESIAPIPGVLTFKADITADETLDLIKEALGGYADVVICDAAPNLSGAWDVDHSKSIDLARSALKMAKKLLKPGGNFLVKVFQGDTFQDYQAEVRREFEKSQAHSPAASRKESAETYIIGKKLIGGPVKIGDVYELQIESIGNSGDGVALVDGFAVIVKGAKLGENVRVKIDAVKHSFAFGKLLDGKH